MLGLVPEGTDLREAYASTLGEAVAGYYDPRKDRLRIVSGAQTANRVLYEMVLAHELTHVLEDQAFGFDLDVLAAGGDRALALTALIEGTASALMYRYVEERFERRGAARRARGVGVRRHRRPAAVPDRAARVPVHGGRGVRGAAAAGRGRRLAGRRRGAALPPAGVDRADPAPGRSTCGSRSRAGSRCAAPRARAGGGLAAAAALDVRRVADAEAARARRRRRARAHAAAGWGGDSYALLGRGDERALVMRWTWDSPRDEAEFAAALRDWEERRCRTRPSAWRSPARPARSRSCSRAGPRRTRTGRLALPRTGR